MTMLKKNLRLTILMLLIAGGLACSGLIGVGNRPSVAGASEYKIRPGDIIEIRFEHYPDFNQTLIVGSQGSLPLRMIGTVRVLDLTLDIFKEIIVEKYSQLLAEPTLSVSVAQSASYTVAISGDIKNPGVLRIRGGLTISEGIVMAGGVLDPSLDYEVLVLRTRSDGVKMHKIDLKKNQGGFPTRDFRLAPSDVVYVKKSISAQTSTKKNAKLI
jgi:protein involved in polysaccharide export with SLBB domain